MKMKQNKQSKLVIALSAVILLLVALSATLTFAYFTSTTNKSSNDLKFDTLTLALDGDHKFTKQTEEHDLDKIVPGCTVNMSGKVNLTGADAYVRMKITISATDKDDAPMTDTAATTAIAEAIGKALQAQATNGTSWVQVGNDWYCVEKFVAANGIIDFTGKSFELDKAKVGNEWQGATIKVEYSFEAIQAGHVELTGETNADKAASLKILMDSVTMESGLVE